MTSRENETSREVVERMLTFVQAEFVPARGPAADLAQGWLAHIVDTARAVLLVNEVDRGDVAAPLRRSVMEHALWMQWLSRHQDAAWATVKAKRRRNVERNEAALREWAVWASDVIDEELSVATCPVPTTKALIEDLLAAERAQWPDLPATGQWWFGAYFLDSELSHPSPNTATMRGALGDRHGMLASLLLPAFAAYSSLIPGNPWVRPLAQFRDDLAAAEREVTVP